MKIELTKAEKRAIWNTEMTIFVIDMFTLAMGAGVVTAVIKMFA